MSTAEDVRLEEDRTRAKNWKRWGPYLSERQWGTVREDYSTDGSCWDFFPHEHARMRAYRWGEDGLMGVTDRQCRLCMAVALWNGKDPILKERLFGLTGPEGNHGEDCKECYYYQESLPTHSYMKMLYKYPQDEYPYSRLVDENRQRSVQDPEYELEDTGAFDDNRYWDVTVEYAKASPDDILCRYTVANRGPAAATLHLLPTLWYRNTWVWGCTHEGCTTKANLMVDKLTPSRVNGRHTTLGESVWELGEGPDGKNPQLLFTENESNSVRLWNKENYTPFVKDAFHRYVVDGELTAVNPKMRGSKVAAHYVLDVDAGSEVSVRLRLCAKDECARSGALDARRFEAVMAARSRECEDFYSSRLPAWMTPEQRNVTRQAYAGLLWSKQFYHYVVKDWLEGDPESPPPPEQRLTGRNTEWRHLFNRDVISMPDKWEYPWYASWDLAFHLVAFSNIDIDFAKDQLLLFLREWYMHPNGQIPAYEFAFGDVNPPVHAWALMKLWRKTGERGHRDTAFLARCFHKLLINFTWWVNRKDPSGKNLFSGGFLGLDNIGVFDRSKPLPMGGELEQADGTAWMAFYCVTMLDMALELAETMPVYEDTASKFFEHFVAIVDAINQTGLGQGLWHEEDGFYYDHLRAGAESTPLRIRSMVGLVPLFSVLVLETTRTEKLRGFTKRTEWFMQNRSDLASRVSLMTINEGDTKQRRALLAIPTKEQLRRVLRHMLDENEFLSPYGIRSLSKYHEDHPFELQCEGSHHVGYIPGESTSDLFGGNSNWRGPIWICMNYLVIESLNRYDYFYGSELTVECPTGSGREMRLSDVAHELNRRMSALFMPDTAGRRPCHGGAEKYTDDPFWKDLVLFYEYFHGDTGKGLGASHQTGWTALIANTMMECKPVKPASPQRPVRRKVQNEAAPAPRPTQGPQLEGANVGKKEQKGAKSRGRRQ